MLASLFEVVGTVGSGTAMISEAMRLNPDVIVADISMPDMTGIEAARRLRARGSMARVVFLTIHSETEFIEACLAAGALGYVAKIHMKTDLIPAINAALAGRSFISTL
jgi:DNA-binding NarL/FixJ family response regulator